MKKILVILLFMFFISCERDEPCGCVIVDIGIQISVTNNDGMDLLDPATPNSFALNDIKLLRSEDGEFKEISGATGDNAGHVEIFPVVGSKNRLYLYTPEEKMFIKWKGTDLDTIECEFKKTSNSKVCSKVWFNSKLVYDSKDGTERYFEVTK